jgi:hypothetical protein
MPFLAGRGQAGRGMFGLGGIPGAPTFFNILTTVTEGNAQLTVEFIAPAFNGRISDYWIPVCLSYFC